MVGSSRRLPYNVLRLWSELQELGPGSVADSFSQMIAGYGAFNTYYHNNLLSQYPLSVTAWIGSVSSCITFAGATIGGTVMDRLGPRKVMMAGTSIMAIGFLALSWVSSIVPWSSESLLM
jgi:MFS family permease